MRNLTLLTLVDHRGPFGRRVRCHRSDPPTGTRVLSESVTIKKGDALTFLNDDSVPHNIMSTSKGNEFNLGSQAPGSSTDVTFKEAGEAHVICAIHPRMKMTVKVTD